MARVDIHGLPGLRVGDWAVFHLGPKVLGVTRGVHIGEVMKLGMKGFPWSAVRERTIKIAWGYPSLKTIDRSALLTAFTTSDEAEACAKIIREQIDQPYLRDAECRLLDHNRVLTDFLYYDKLPTKEAAHV